MYVHQKYRPYIDWGFHWYERKWHFFTRNRASSVLKASFLEKSFENDVVIVPELLVKFPDGRKDEAIDGEQHQW